MKYNLNGKTINISDTDIERSMKCLEISKDEAIQMWLEDEGYLENEEQEELCRKAKENRVTSTIHQAKATEPKKKTQKERVRKENPTKEKVIAETAEMLRQFADNVQILNVGKLISFELDGKKFEFDLKQKREPKKQAEIGQFLCKLP